MQMKTSAKESEPGSDANSNVFVELPTGQINHGLLVQKQPLPTLLAKQPRARHLLVAAS